MKRLFLALVVLTCSVVAAWGALPTVTLEAKYTDTGATIDIANIVPYREVEFKWLTVADTTSITYNAFVHGQINGNVVHNIHEQGTISTNTSPIPYSLKVTFQSLEEGEISFFPKDANDMTGASQHNFKAVYGTPPVISVTGVKIGEDNILSAPSESMEIELDMDWNRGKTLKVTIEPENATNKNVTWTSNNETVATVNNGRIEAQGPGEATITVNTEDGGFTATCKVKVTRDGATSITLDQSSMFMTVGDERLISVSSNTFLRDYQKTKAELSVPDVVRVEKNNYSEMVFTVTAIKAGETILTVSTEGANGDTIKATCAITVTAATTPATPETPATPNTPATPSTPTTPDSTVTPNTPETPNTPDTPTPPTPDNPVTPQTPDRKEDTGGSGGGCNAGFLGLAVLAALAMKKM